MSKKDLTIKLIATTKDNKVGYFVESDGNHGLLPLLMLHAWATEELATICKERGITAEELTKLRKVIMQEDLNNEESK